MTSLTLTNGWKPDTGLGYMKSGKNWVLEVHHAHYEPREIVWSCYVYKDNDLWDESICTRRGAIRWFMRPEGHPCDDAFKEGMKIAQQHLAAFLGVDPATL